MPDRRVPPQSVSQPLSAGTVFGAGGAYTLLRLLGAGGMGSVYLARQNSLGRDVAVKVLRTLTATSEVPGPESQVPGPESQVPGPESQVEAPGNGDRETGNAREKRGPDAAQRFLAEPRLMVRFPDASASHIVPVLDCGTDPATGLLYYVMEAYLLTPEDARSVRESVFQRPVPDTAPAVAESAPLTLEDLIHDGHTIPDGPLAQIGLEILNALETLHAAGIVHRDLKPSNLLFAPTGRLLLADFGIAKDLAPEADGFTRPDAAAQPGSRHYAAPEQTSGLEAVPATDYYALGIVLFRALTGGFPPLGRIRLPEDSATPFRRHWRRLLARLLEPDPARRLHRAAEVRAALRGILRADALRTQMRGAWGRRMLYAATGVALAACLAWAVLHGGALFQERHPVGTVRTVTLPGGAALDLVWVPAGSFPVETLGSTRTVVISRGFWLGKTEVTKEQWKSVMGLASEGGPTGRPEASPMTETGDDLPMSRVSWDDCAEFLEKANAGMEGVRLALPTEAQWELAARGPQDGKEAFHSETDETAWHAGNSGRKPHPVGGLAPNGYGLCDMSGNVAEWCRDWDAHPRFDEGRGTVRDPMGPATGAERVCRGGAYLSAPDHVGAAARAAHFPDARLPHIGLRVVCEP